MPLPHETAARIEDALSAGRKIEAVRWYREATGASLADAKAFIDQLEAGSVTLADAVTTEKPAFSLTDHGWLVEPTDDGGVRLRCSAFWRGVTIGCTAMVGVFFSPILIILWWMRDRILDAGPGGGAWQVLSLLIPLAFVGFAGLFFAAILWQMLRIALWREEWEATRNLLIVRRGLMGMLRERELRGGEFLLEPHFAGENVMKWRLAVVCDGEKHYLLREPDLRVGFQAMHSK
jgi:hypothetical protein